MLSEPQMSEPSPGQGIGAGWMQLALHLTSAAPGKKGASRVSNPRGLTRYNRAGVSMQVVSKLLDAELTPCNSWIFLFRFPSPHSPVYLWRSVEWFKGWNQSGPPSLPVPHMMAHHTSRAHTHPNTHTHTTHTHTWIGWRCPYNKGCNLANCFSEILSIITSFFLEFLFLVCGSCKTGIL